MTKDFQRKLLGFIRVFFTHSFFLNLCFLIPLSYGAEIPVIESSSKTDIDIERGDELVLEVNARGEDLQYRWTYLGQTLCETPRCKLETLSWTLGTQKIVAEVFNTAGSSKIEFKIKVKEKLKSFVKQDLVPDSSVQTDKDQEWLRTDDFYVQAVKGVGYLTSKNGKMSVIEDEKRLISWPRKKEGKEGKELISAPPASMLLFGKDAREVHFLLPRTKVALQMSDDTKTHTKKRNMILQEGTLRCRQIYSEESDLDWRVLIGEWAVVVPSGHSDFIITRSEQDKAKLTVLRGQVKIAQNSNEVIIPQGIMVHLQEKNEDQKTEEDLLQEPFHTINPEYFNRPSYPIFLSPEHTFVGDVFRLTTSEYVFTTFDEAKEAERRKIAVFLLSDDKRPDLGNADKVNLLLSQKDYMKALEILRASFYVAKKTTKRSDEEYLYLLALARCYKGLFLFDEAIKIYKNVIKIRPDSTMAYHELGRVYVASGDWKTAILWLKKAQSKNDARPQKNNYLRGLSYFQEDRFYWAEQYFGLSLWEGVENNTTDVTRRYLKLLEKENETMIHTSLGVFYDSNIFHIAKSINPPIEITHRSGSGYLTGLDLNVGVFGDETASFNVNVGALRRSYFMSGLSKASVLDVYANSEMSMIFGASRTIDIYLKPFLGVTALGPTRARDSFGFVYKMGSSKTS